MSDKSDAEERLFQVVFDLPEESPHWPLVRHERLWAAKTQVKLHLALRNAPFYCRGVAYGDVILVRPDDDRREIVFDRFVSESGHSAVQLLIDSPEFRGELDRILSRFNVTWETANNDTYYAVDIKPETNYATLRSELISAKKHGDIGVRESAISHHHQAQLPSFP